MSIDATHIDFDDVSIDKNRYLSIWQMTNRIEIDIVGIIDTRTDTLIDIDFDIENSTTYRRTRARARVRAHM